MATPRIIDHPLYRLLREGNIVEFNRRKGVGESCDLTACDFRALDLRNLDADGLDLSNGYFRATDLRGLDLRNTKLEGASFAGAKISGCYFPKEMDPQEIIMSVEYGTRVRYR